MTEKEREERVELLRTSGYGNVTIIPSIPSVDTSKFPHNLDHVKDLPISINNPAVQPTMFGQVNLPDDKNPARYLFGFLQDKQCLVHISDQCQKEE